MNWAWIVLVGVVIMSTSLDAAPPALREQADELERLWGEQYLKRDDPKEIERLNAAVERARQTLGDDGRFSDLSYGPIITGRDGGQGWGEHLIRVTDLFTAWRLPGTSATGDTALVQRAAKALESYLATPYNRNDVWGFGHPYANLLESNRIGRICLFARTDPNTFKQADVQRWADHITERAIHSIFLPSDNPDEQFEQIRRGWEGGANVMWATRGELVPYLINDDQDLRIRAIDAYMKHIWDSQTVLSPKGPLGQIERLTIDGMLGEHATPAMGSYGEWYINAVVEYRDLIQGVERWQMPAELNAFWIDFLIDSMAHTYQGAVDPHLGNPLVWLNARRDGNAKLKEWLTAFSPSGHRADEVQALINWAPGVTDWPIASQSIKYYYTTDYITKHFPRFQASLRAVSERTFGMETFNQKDNRRAIESILLPLGTTLVRRDARAFQDLETKGAFGAIDYARLPGQTTRQVSGAELAGAWNRDPSGYAVRMVFGNLPFSGAATTAHTGVMGWWQSRYVVVDRDRPNQLKSTDLSVNGRRATFFLDDAVVHLGSAFDIRHDAQPTFTSVEQRQSGAMTTTYAIGDSVRTVNRGETVRDAGITWVWHDGVGYLPPSDGEKVVRDVEQPGDPAVQIFSIWSDHGRENRNLNFEWAVLPGVSVEDMPGLARERSWQVVENQPTVQAIAVPARQTAYIVFHDHVAVEVLGRAVEVDRPCVMIVELRENQPVVTIGDPLQQGGPIHVRVGDRSGVIEMPGYPHLGKPIRTVLP